MSACAVQESGSIELFFYNELDPVERTAIGRHLAACAECRHTLEELTIIRAALATRPAVSAPPGEDWGGFMARLDDAIRRESLPASSAPVVLEFVPEPALLHHGRTRIRRSFVPAVAMAALITLVTMSVTYVVRTRPELSPAPERVDRAGPASTDTAFASLSEQHFERSKLVVLGLANKGADRETDWDYERRLASTLLSDTRLYRQAAEERGRTSLARVLGDLELVLLQTSMSEQHDPATLQQIQSLIRKRDLVTKMNVTMAGGM
jgi:hypothetical protein